MTTRARIYGGLNIGGIVTRARSIYDGVEIEHRGSTRTSDGRMEPASITVAMNPHDALDLALCLIRAAEQHGTESQRGVDVLIRRLAKAADKQKRSATR